MFTFIMVASMFAGILLLKVSPALSLFCWIGTYYAGRRATAEDESRFMGIVFVLAILGLAASFLTGVLG